MVTPADSEKIGYKIQHTRTREMAQGVRAITTLAGDPGSLPSTHSLLLFPEDLTPSDLCGYLHIQGT